MVKPVLAALLAVLSLPALAAAPDRSAAPLPSVSSAAFFTTPVVLANGVAGELVTIVSHSPVDWAPALRGDIGPAVRLNGQLFRPADAHGRIAAVIMVPGSGNIGTHHLAEASALVSRGFAVLLVDPFRARGIADTIADQSRLTWPASAYDVLAATRFLRTRADVDPRRIGALGSSRGATAAMMAASRPLSDAVLGKGRGLRAVFAGYPWCGTQFRSAQLATGTALMLLQGDRDDWVSPQQCQDAVHAMIVAGQDAAMKIVPGAYHAFDRADVPPTRLAEAFTSTTFPTVYMNDAGVYYSLRTGQLDPALRPADFTDYAVSGNFSHKGATIGSRPGDAALFMTEMLDFLTARLK